MLSKIKNNSVLMISIIVVVSKLIGILRDVVLANYFGTSNISDAYLIASSVPTLLFYFIGHSIATAYIPMYNKVKNDKGNHAGLSYTNSIINISLIVSTVLVVAIFIWPEYTVQIFASGFDESTSKIAVEILRISVASIYLMSLISVLGGYLNANKSFIAPAAVGLPRNAVIIASIIVASSFGMQWLGYGLLCSYLAELLLLVPVSIKNGYRYKLELKISDPSIKETWYVVLPILIGMCVGQINKIIDRSLASNVCEGGVSALTYASIINTAVQEVFVTGIITVLFSHCAEWVAKGEHKKVLEKLASVLDVSIMILVPVTFGVFMLAKPIVELLLQRGEFNNESVSMTASALCAYTMGLVFLAARDVLVKVFYAYKKTKITTIIGIFSILLNIVLNLILYQIIGLSGLALATAVSAIFNCIVLYILLRKEIGDFGLKGTSITFAKSVISSGIMAVVIYFVNISLGSLPVILGVPICTIVGMLVYFVAALLLRMKPLLSMLSNICKIKTQIQ